MKVLLIGAHRTAGPSMHRYTQMALRAWSELGHQVVLVTPPDCLSRRVRAKGEIQKWIAYAEKFVAFAPQLRRRSVDADVIHIPDHSDAIYALMLPASARTLVTVHDLFAVSASLGQVPGYTVRWSGRQYQGLVRRGLKRASHLVAVSDATRSEVKAVVKRDAQVVHLPVPLAGQPASRAIRRHVLVIAPAHWRKRRDMSLSVWQGLRTTERFAQVPLVVVGSPLSAEERRLLGADIEHVSVRQEISDEELADCYASARAVIVMSRYEGFGLPVLEAQAHDVPVLCSDIPVFREIAGDGAVFLDTSRLDDVDWQLAAQALEAPDLVERARRNAARFSDEAFVANFGKTMSAQQ